MRGLFVWHCTGLLAVLLLASWQHAQAVIKADKPLDAMEREATHILVGKVEKHFPDKPALLVKLTGEIKGKAPFQLLPINCKVDDAKAYKENQIEPLLKRFGPDLEIVFFIRLREESLKTFAYANGTWFQLQGTLVEKDKAVFALVSAEPYFRKTFHGSTADLVRVLKDHAAGKGKLPALDAKEKPGLGPEYAPSKTGARFPTTSDSLFAVIPTVGIGAPLMILALLFPTVFGGVFVLFRQWLAFITVISINSTLMLLHWWLGPTYLRGTWWINPDALWYAMTLVAFVCTLWAWRRQLDFLAAGEHEVAAKTELLVLVLITASCLAAAIATWYLAQPTWRDATWAITLVMTVGISAGLLYRSMHAMITPALFAAPPMATEGVILGVMLLGHVLYVPILMGGNTAGGTTEFNESAAHSTAAITPAVKRWEHSLTERGFYCSAPVIAGDKLYAAASHAGFGEGTLVCIDWQTGLQKWAFIDKGTLKQIISTPCIADGKLYIGEGFHDDKKCKVYCVDADSGEKVWHYETDGQTESSPAVSGGKVYIGAGNEGVLCLDASNGKLIWQFPGPDYKGRLLRFGAGMTVVGDRLYCGTGVDRNRQDDKGETAILCLDRNTGKQLWKAESPYPVWSTPIVKDGQVFVGTGNGDVLGDVLPPDVPGGALLCLDATTGKELWRHKVQNGIIEAPAVDAHRVYFGCRDMHVHCIGRDGKPRWERQLDASPVLASPVLDSDPLYERTVSVFVASVGGKICCLNPANGEIVWSHDLSEQRPYIATKPQLIVTRTNEGYRRQLFIACGLGGGLTDVVNHRAAVLCLEDRVNVK
jgi:outer membrane protein assembly factor BamB